MERSNGSSTGHRVDTRPHLPRRKNVDTRPPLKQELQPTSGVGEQHGSEDDDARDQQSVLCRTSSRAG
eukprot:3877332-Amphidinium_carterae.1